MHVDVTFKNIDPSDALKASVNKKLAKLDKLIYKPAEARAVFSIEKTRHIVEVNLTGAKLNMRARESSDNMYSSIDLVVDKLRAQLSKKNGKIYDHKSKEGIKGGMLTGEETFTEADFEDYGSTTH
jgi:putative sigma-54 modulation protein